MIIERVHNTNCPWSETHQQKIDAIHEDIHWMFLIAGNLIFLDENIFNHIIYEITFSGNIITVDSEGEPNMIPSEIMHNSIKQSKNVNIDLSLKFLTNQMLIIDVPGADKAVDDIIK